jgi:tRNA(Arg) A34 adenosine deaminase TadA
MFFRVCLLVLLFWSTACSTSKKMEPHLVLPFQEYSVKDPIQQEIDEIYSLLTYALVYANWQPGSVPRNQRRGYNIGAVLVDKSRKPVFYGLNCINSTDNATQHGEVRAITAYLEKTRCFNLDGFSIYTSLEPCIMCAGMMTMTDIDRVIYGQKDVDFSNGLERLALDTREYGGYAPFKRTTLADATPSGFRTRLDEAYQHFLAVDPEKVLAKFLTSSEAEGIFKEASVQFLNFRAKYPTNNEIYSLARAFFDENKVYKSPGKN